VRVVEPLGVQQGEARQHARVEAVALGVFAVVGAQIRRLLRRHQHHVRTLSPEPCGERHPGVAGGLHDYGDVGRLHILGQHAPQTFEVTASGAEPAPDPYQLPRLVGETCLMRGATSDIDPQA
jgi:hypothetical protein